MHMYPEPLAPSVGVDYAVGLCLSGISGILLAKGTNGTTIHPVLLEDGCSLLITNIPLDLQERLSVQPTQTAELRSNPQHKWDVVVDRSVRIPLSEFAADGVLVRLLATGTV